jgi:hypothetical protein
MRVCDMFSGLVTIMVGICNLQNIGAFSMTREHVVAFSRHRKPNNFPLFDDYKLQLQNMHLGQKMGKG